MPGGSGACTWEVEVGRTHLCEFKTSFEASFRTTRAATKENLSQKTRKIKKKKEKEEKNEKERNV